MILGRVRIGEWHQSEYLTCRCDDWLVKRETENELDRESDDLSAV
jgi:hypothetical protein